MNYYKVECNKCSNKTDNYVITDDGLEICDDCQLSLCSLCLDGECEVETTDGDYICHDCYANMKDNAHEYFKEQQ